jgi:hypothetical protein
MDWTPGWWLALSGLLVVPLVVNPCVRFIRACWEKRHSLTGC